MLKNKNLLNSLYYIKLYIVYQKENFTFCIFFIENNI